MQVTGPILQAIPTKSNGRRIVCWQGWQVEMPRRWDPVKLEGDHAQGYALFADALRPRLGIRWQTPRNKSLFSRRTVSTGVAAASAINAIRLALRQEVGQLAADEAKPFESIGALWLAPLLYTEPHPPGRDVFSSFSLTSGRLLQIAYHAHRRERILAASILPTLLDLSIDRATRWSIFDLNCMIPARMMLKSQRLNAGDLGLTFADHHHQLTIRQIAVATLALQRQNLDGWIIDQYQTNKRYHRQTNTFTDTTITIGANDLPARLSRTVRRRRFFLMRSQPKDFTTIAAHDEVRDRIVILHGTDESLLRVIGATVGTIAMS